MSVYDSADINCGPSYGLHFQAERWGSLWNKLNLVFLLPYLQKGPVLNIPDYEGSNAACTVGPQSAFHTLDSIRAALQSTDYTNISSDAMVIMFGYSGGAFATELATEKLGGLPPNITSTYNNINKGPMAEVNIAAILGVMNAYPEMDE
ncbi:hypothetical protein N7486_003573 [Penicillium sp. IBT 16267x]|nr:hypothetical protein N7486_003573 [Penicillium sp. IBT 16267x]